VERRQVLNDVDRWTLNGRLALQQEQEAWHASIYWQQQGQTFDIRLISPLGSGVVFIEGDSSGVLLRLPEGKTLTAPDAEYLLYEQVGWRMPLAGLHYWVRGLPQPDAPFTKALDEQGRLVSLHQAGWDIRFPSYVRVAGVDLPRKVFLENHPLSVRLVIQSWDRG
jgi:outer membrane lipoprotein LolB